MPKTAMLCGLCPRKACKLRTRRNTRFEASPRSSSPAFLHWRTSDVTYVSITATLPFILIGTIFIERSVMEECCLICRKGRGGRLTSLKWKKTEKKKSSSSIRDQ